MKSSKFVLFILLLLTNCAFLLCNDVGLNQYGHIAEMEAKESDVEYFLRDTDYHLEIDGVVLKGNTVHCIENGYLTLTTLEENVETMVRIYDLTGNLRLEQDFRRVVGLKLARGLDYSAFYNENNIIRIDHESLNISEHDGMNVFDLDEQGNIVTYSLESEELIFLNERYSLSEIPRKIFFNNSEPVIFTSDAIFLISNNSLTELGSFDGSFFDAKIIEDEIYYVIKKDLYSEIRYELYGLGRSQLLEEQVRERDMTRIHDPIPAPLNHGEEDYPFLIGNSYGALQEYGNALYMHPGVDFNGDDYQEVYAVRDGYVKAVITTGGAPYWRVAIANEDTPDEADGYLYAHLNEESITVAVGDTVYAGDLLGTLFDWQVLDFTHIHFARLRHAGEVWDGAWWTIDSPQIDFTNLCDSIPPQFDPTIDNDLFAFRNEDGDYLDPNNLTGEFDIISKCRDYCNSSWAQGPYDMWFSIASAFTPDVVLYESPHLVWDMPTDVYNFGQYSFLCVNTFYSRDDILFSTVGYDYIEAYHIVTNADEDPEINELDAEHMFDSAQFDDGLYMIYVHARDQSLNEGYGTMMVTFNNGVDADEEEIPDIGEVNLYNYPNPFNPETKIFFEIPEEGRLKLEIFNARGQLVTTLADGIFEAGEYNVEWDGDDDLGTPQASGLYLYKLHYKNTKFTKKMLILK